MNQVYTGKSIELDVFKQDHHAYSLSLIIAAVSFVGVAIGAAAVVLAIVAKVAGVLFVDVVPVVAGAVPVAVIAVLSSAADMVHHGRDHHG